MGIFLYFIPATLLFVLALGMRRAVRRLTADWHPTTVFERRNVLKAILRAFPYAFAFAPFMLMERGLGVLIPASLFLCVSIPAAIFDLVSGKISFRAMEHLAGASKSLLVVWWILAVIFFIVQSASISPKKNDETKERSLNR